MFPTDSNCESYPSIVYMHDHKNKLLLLYVNKTNSQPDRFNRLTSVKGWLAIKPIKFTERIISALSARFEDRITVLEISDHVGEVVTYLEEDLSQKEVCLWEKSEEELNDTYKHIMFAPDIAPDTSESDLIFYASVDVVGGSISHANIQESSKKPEYIFIGVWFLFNAYNLGNGIFNTHGLSLKYCFQLTHITSFAILAIEIISLYKKYFNKETGSLFSNGVSFVFGLSIVTDVMFWLYVNPGLHFNTFSSGIDSADLLIMHGLITVILLGWMIHQKQIPFLKNYKHFEGNTTCKVAKTAAGIAIPIALIASIYMGVTYLGQKYLLHNQAIYQNVLDWNHPTLTYHTFAKASIGFLALMITYWMVTGLIHVIRNCSNPHNRFPSLLYSPTISYQAVRITHDDDEIEVDEERVVFQSC